LALLRPAVIGGWLLAIVLGIFLPIYTDEVGWRFQERAGIDGVDKMFSDTCGTNVLATPPPFMWPLRLISAALNTTFAAPVWVRLSGIVHALLWGVLVLAIVRRIGTDRAERAALAIIGLALVSLANTPLLLVMSRPEQPIILAAAAAVLLALPPRDGASAVSPLGAWLRSAAVLVLAAIALGYHAKALMLVPLFAAAIALASRGRASLVARIACGVALAVMTLSAAHYWGARLSCPDDPVLRAEYARNSSAMVLADLHSWHDLTPVIAQLRHNLDPRAYVSLAAPEPFPLSDWLPARQIGWAASAQWTRALTWLWTVALVLGAIGLVAGLVTIARRRAIDARVVFALGLLAAVFGWGATRLVRNFYEAGFLLPLLALAVVLALGGLQARPLRIARDLAAGLLGIAALVSIVLTIALWRPSLSAAWQEGGYLDRQGHSIAIRGFAAVAADVRAAARLCHIPPPEQARALMLDDVSYFPYMRSYRPQHQLGVLGLWQGTIRDPVAYLKSKGSSGALVTCKLLPPALRARAKQAGDICCLAPPDW
jgi:hypothetical protein